MNKDLFVKLKNALSGRLLILRKKINRELFKKHSMNLHSRMVKGKEAVKRFGSKCKASAEQLRAKTPRELAAALAAALRNTNWTVAKARAIPVSLVLIILVLYSGSFSSLAWYTDVTETDRNSFEVGDMDLQVFYRNDSMEEYEELTENTDVFRDGALYEPGYTQVVLFKIVNAGNVPFEYMISLVENEALAVDSVNVYGGKLHLADHLRFGVVSAETEEELKQAIATRELARATDDGSVKDLCVGTYSEYQDATLNENDVHYAALVVYMPEYIENEANYDRNFPAPRTVLGITVYAQQAGTLEHS